MSLVDERLELDADDMCEQMEVQRVLNTAILCVQLAPEKRPVMFRVLAMLAGDADTKLPETGDSNNWSGFRGSPSFTEHSFCRTECSSVTNGNATVELTEVLCR